MKILISGTRGNFGSRLVEKLETIKIDIKKEEKSLINKSRKVFKKRKFRKKFYKKKTK